MSKTTEFDPANYLHSEGVVAQYHNLALASGDTYLLLTPIGDVTKARFDSTFKVLQALGVQMQAHPVPQQP